MIIAGMPLVHISKCIFTIRSLRRRFLQRFARHWKNWNCKFHCIISFKFPSLLRYVGSIKQPFSMWLLGVKWKRQALCKAKKLEWCVLVHELSLSASILRYLLLARCAFFYKSNQLSLDANVIHGPPPISWRHHRFHNLPTKHLMSSPMVPCSR